jgi:hypothetical protein
MKNTGLFLMALWLVAQGILSLTKLHFPYEKQLLSSVALCAGIVMLLHGVKTRLGDIGLLLLSLWLILRSSLFLFHYTFPYSDVILAILAIVAGLFLIIRK